MAILREGPIPVGSLSVRERPACVSVAVHDAPISGPVTCQLLARNGTVVTVGRFHVIDGSGSWSALDPAGVGAHWGGRLVDPTGLVQSPTRRAG